jgi:hypothetical protein
VAGSTKKQLNESLGTYFFEIAALFLYLPLMKKVLFLLALAISPVFAFSQYYWEAGLQLGASNYLGEMGGEQETRKDFVADLKFNQTRWDVGGFARYKAGQSVSIKGTLNYLRIAGADSLSTNPGRAGRNLSFKNDIFEANITGQYFFYEINDLGHTYRYRNDFRTYAFAGLGVFYHNPKANYNGEWVALQPLRTEGQIEPYKKIGMSIPMGVGLYFTIEKKYRIGWEMSWSKTFTDYLDDVSTVYADPASLDPLAAELANRTDELSNPPAPRENFEAGNKRGDPTHKDNFMYTSVTASYVFRGKSNFYRSRYSNHIFHGKKYKKRKKRAKF